MPIYKCKTSQVCKLLVGDESDGTARLFVPLPETCRNVNGKEGSSPIASENAERTSSKITSSDMSELNVTFPCSPNSANLILCLPRGIEMLFVCLENVLGKQIISRLYWVTFGAFSFFECFAVFLLKNDESLSSLDLGK